MGFQVLFAQNADEECTKVVSPALIVMPENRLALQWQACSIADSFDVISDTIGKIPADCGVRYKTPNHEQTFTGLFSGQTYQFLIRSNCQEDYSDWRWFFVNYRSAAETKTVPFAMSNLDSIGFIYANDSNTYSFKYLDIVIDTLAVSTYVDFVYRANSSLDTNSVKLYLLSPYSAIGMDDPISENYRIGGIYSATDTIGQHSHIELNGDISGAKLRLVFAWKNTDGNTIDMPILIDSLKINSRFCAVADSLRVTELSSHSAIIAWRAEYGQESFQLEYKKTSDTAWIIQSNVENNFLIENLLPNTYYTVRVKVLCDNEESLYSENFNFKTLIDLHTPTNVNILTKDTLIYISWPEIENATGYTIAYKKSEGNENWSEKFTEQNNTIIDSLQPDTEYILKIKALHNETQSSWSQTSTFRTKCLTTTIYPYNVAQEFFVDSENNSLPSCWFYDTVLYSPSFDFTAISFPYISFDYKSSTSTTVQISIDGGESFTFLRQLPQTTSFSSQIFSLLSFVGYENVVLRFLTYDSANNTNISFGMKNFVLQSACPLTTNITVSNITQNSFTLSWQEDELTYKISLKDEQNNILNQITTQNNNHTFSNLSPHTTYKVVISPLCENIPTLDSMELEVQTLSSPTCLMPEDFNVEWVHSDMDEVVLVTWASEANIWQILSKDYYAVKWDTTIVKINPVFTLRNLEIGHTYSVKARTICNVGDTSDFTEVKHVYIGASNLTQMQGADKDILVFPIPTLDKIKIISDNRNLSRIVVYKENGKKVLDKEYTKQEINLKDFGKGVYFVVIMDEKNNKTTKKIIVE